MRIVFAINRETVGIVGLKGYWFHGIVSLHQGNELRSWVESVVESLIRCCPADFLDCVLTTHNLDLLGSAFLTKVLARSALR